MFDPAVKWRLAEEFGPQSFTETENGKLLFSADYSDMENLVTWLLTFGDKAEVLEPAEARRQIQSMAVNMIKTYKEQKNGV